MDEHFRMQPQQQIDGIDIFLTSGQLDAFKNTESAFWDLQYKDRDVAAVDTMRTHSFHRHFRRPLFALPHDATILEIGCGSRSDMLELAADGRTVILSDISLEAVRKAKERAGAMHVAERCSFAVCDAENLPYTDGTLDAVFIAASLHHLPHPERGIAEFFRVLKPGGLLVIGVEPSTWPYYTLYPLLRPLQRLIRKRRGRPINSIADDTTHGFSYFALRRMMPKAGFRIRDIKPVKFTTELYDSGVALVSKLTGKRLATSERTTRALLRFDDLLGRIPVLRWFPWHWNVIAEKPAKSDLHHSSP